MTSPITIDAAMEDKALLGAALGDLATWQTWRTVLRGAFALPFTDDDRRTFAAIAGGREPPAQRDCGSTPAGDRAKAGLPGWWAFILLPLWPIA
jgi:hypothetical protein